MNINENTMINVHSPIFFKLCLFTCILVSEATKSKQIAKKNIVSANGTPTPNITLFSNGFDASTGVVAPSNLLTADTPGTIMKFPNTVRKINAPAPHAIEPKVDSLLFFKGIVLFVSSNINIAVNAVKAA